VPEMKSRGYAAQGEKKHIKNNTKAWGAGEGKDS